MNVARGELPGFLAAPRSRRAQFRVEEIEDPVMQGVRYLDKLIDELAKGRPMEKILRKV